MAIAPQWFDEEYYIAEKANQLLSKYPDQYTDLDSAKEAFLNALNQLGWSPYDHYVLWGDDEGLSPNPLFDREYYINEKAQQLVDSGKASDIDSAKTLFLNTIKDLGMTVYEHFHKWGWKEGLNPSSVFDIDTYFSNKLAQLKEMDPDKYGNWTVDDVKNAFESAGLDPAEHAILYGKDEGVVPSEALEQIEKAQNPGQNFTLTSDTDTITGTSGADTITGVVSALSKERTLNPTDQIDGGDGKDTIELDVKGSFSGFSGDGKLVNVETVKLTNSGDISRTFTAKEVTGVEKYIIEAEKSTVNLSSLAEIPNEVDLKVAKDTTIGFAKDVTKGTSDEMTVKVKDVGSSDKVVGITVNGIEKINLDSEGSKGNYVKLSDDKLKELVINGDKDLSLLGIGATVTSVDGSNASSKLTIDLTNAGTNLSAIKTGSGDDTIKIKLGNIKANAEIDGGEGADTLEVKSSAANTVQFKMGNVETIKFDNITTGAVTFSAKDTSGLENIIATKNVAQNITLANLGGIDLNVELQGANASGSSISLDHSGSTVVNVDTPSSNATATNPDENQLNINLTNSASLDLKVASNMAYSGDITAGKAETLTISVDGQLSTAGNIATITAGNATSITISKVAHDSALELQAAKAVSLNATASADLDLNPAGTTPDLSGLQELTISIEGDNNVATLPNLPKIHSVTLSGSGSVDLGNLGSATLSDYGIEINASDLAGDDAAAGFSLDIGTIDTKGTDITVDASKVLGKVNIGAINALNGATTAGDVTLDFDGTGGNITINAITGKDVTINAAGALGTVKYGGNINVSGSLDLTGVDLQNNTLDGTAGSGTINPTGSSFTANITGGIKNDSFKIVTADANDTTSITVKGDLGIGTDNLTVDASAESNKDVTIDISALSNADTTIIGGQQKDTIKGSAGNDIIKGWMGIDTITTGDGNDKIVLNYFNNADKITDFTSGKDQILIDFDKAGKTANKIQVVKTPAGTATGGKLGTKLTPANSKVHILNSKGTLKTLTVKNKGVTVTLSKDTGTAALTSNMLFTASKTAALKSAIKSKANNLGTNKAVVFGVTTANHKLYIFAVSDTKAAAASGGKIVQTLQVATLSANPKATDIHIF